MQVEDLYKIFDNKFNEVMLPYLNKILIRNEFSEPIWYIIDNFHWRRFRAVFPIIFAEKYNIPIKNMLPIATASELIFATALIQDDLIDEDEKRTNIKTTHIIFGIPRTVASFGYVEGCVNKILSEIDKLNINNDIKNKIKINFLKSRKELYESFILEKLNKGKINITKKDILNIYLKKTSTGINALYCAALLCEKAPKNFARDILEYSKLLASAGQIKNDVYDLVSWRKYPDARGYSDLKNGYMTYAIWNLLDKSLKKEREIIERALKYGINANYILKLMKKYNIINECIKDCQDLGDKAIKLIKGKYPEIEEYLLAWVEGNRRFTRL